MREVFFFGDLGGRVREGAELQVHGRDARPVVGDLDAGEAAVFEAEGDLAGAGVEGVVEKLAHDRGGPVDHLAGGDLAGDLVAQPMDARPRRGPGSAPRGSPSRCVRRAHQKWIWVSMLMVVARSGRSPS